VTNKAGGYSDVSRLDPNGRRPSNIEQIPSASDRVRRFEETYVLEEVEWLKGQANVEKAVRERGMRIHALVYDKEANECVRLVEEVEEQPEQAHSTA
jgi:carbonic anhydrase